MSVCFHREICIKSYLRVRKGDKCVSLRALSVTCVCVCSLCVHGRVKFVHVLSVCVCAVCACSCACSGRTPALSRKLNSRSLRVAVFGVLVVWLVFFGGSFGAQIRANGDKVLRPGAGHQHAGLRVPESRQRRPHHEHHPVPDHGLQADARHRQEGGERGRPGSAPAADGRPERPEHLLRPRLDAHQPAGHPDVRHHAQGEECEVHMCAAVTPAATPVSPGNTWLAPPQGGAAGPQSSRKTGNRKNIYISIYQILFVF